VIPKRGANLTLILHAGLGCCNKKSSFLHECATQFANRSWAHCRMCGESFQLAQTGTLKTYADWQVANLPHSSPAGRNDRPTLTNPVMHVFALRRNWGWSHHLGYNPKVPR